MKQASSSRSAGTIRLLCGSAALAVAAAAHAAVVSGHLTEEEDREAVKGAAIEIVELHRTVTTGVDGAYRFTNVAPGNYTLRISLREKADKSVDKAIVVGEEKTLVADVTLTAGFGKRDGGGLEAILVTSSRIGLSLSRSTEIDAPNIISMITAEEIRQLPDISAAEAVRRLPGVSAENDTGEARFINIRGLDADLNGTTFAGVRLLPTNPSSPLGGGRAVAFDTIPAGLLGSATVTKTNIPEQDAEALGGTIELSPRRLLAGDKPFVSARIGTGYEELRGTKVGDFQLVGGTRFGLGGGESQFSAVGAIAYYEDRRGIDDLESGYADAQPGTPDKALQKLEQRWYQNGRKRLGFGGELAFEPSEHHRYYLDAYQSGYTETQFKDYLNIYFVNSGAGAVVAPGNANGLTDQIDYYRRSLTDHKETLRARLASLGGQDEIEDSVLDYRISFTDGSYEVTKDIGADFETAHGLNVPITYDNTTNPNFPAYAVVGGPDRLDPTQYTLANVNPSTEHDIDKEWSGVINLSLPMNHWGTGEELKVGIGGRFRDKVLRPNQIIFSSLPGVALTPYVSGGPFSYYKNDYVVGPPFNTNAWESFYAANFNQSSGLPIDPVAGATADEQKYEHNEEKIYAAYGQYKVTFGKLGILGGLRIESTHASYAANAFNGDTNTLIGLNTQGKSYTNAFPTIQMRYEIEPRTILRGTVSSAIARPGFPQITAAVSTSPSANTISQGNPALRPTTAYSIDFSIEHFTENGSLASLGLFDKELKNYIVQTVTNVPVGLLPPTPIYAGFSSPTVAITDYTNISQARAAGFELAWEQKFTALPGFLRGLGAGANWTWVSSRGDIGRGYTSQLPSTAKNTVNAGIFYEQGPLELKLAGYFTSRVLFNPSLGTPSGAQDSYQDRRILLDFGVQYRVTEVVGLYFDAKNLTNDAMRYSEGSQNRPIQREFYGRTLLGGVNLKF